MTEDHLASCCHHCRSLHQQGLNSNQAFHADTQLSLGATGPPRCLCALKLKNIVSKTVCVFLPLYFRHYRNDLSRHEPAAASPRDPSHVLHSSSLKISTQRLFNHQRGGDYYWILFLFSSWELSHLGGGGGGFCYLCQITEIALTHDSRTHICCFIFTQNRKWSHIFRSGINSGSQLKSDFGYNKVIRGDLH